MEAFQAHVVDVLVIGAGAAGVNAAFELHKHGFVGYIDHARIADTGWAPLGSYVVLDANPGPGGSWQHRWPSLRMDALGEIEQLPDFPLPPFTPRESVLRFMPSYFAEFEHEHDLPVIRPVTVYEAVNSGLRVAQRDEMLQGAGESAIGDAKLGELIELHTSAGVWRAKYVVNCSGSWDTPFVPYMPGTEIFAGRQYHIRNCPGPERFWKQRVLVVGTGEYARAYVQELVHEAKKVRWVAQGVTADPSEPSAPCAQPRPIFDRLDASGAWWGDYHEHYEAIIWATGFRPNLSHMRALKLRSQGLGVRLDGTRALLDHRVHLLGYERESGASNTREQARQAVRAIAESLVSFA